MDVIFRSKATPEEAQPNPSVRIEGEGEAVSSDSVELTFMEHRSVKGVPFTACHYGIDSAYQHLTPTDQKNLEIFEDYISSKVMSGEFQDTPKAAIAIIEEVEKKLGLKPENGAYYKLAKIADFLKVTKLDADKTLVKKYVRPQTEKKPQIPIEEKEEEKPKFVPNMLNSQNPELNQPQAKELKKPQYDANHRQIYRLDALISDAEDRMEKMFYKKFAQINHTKEQSK